MIVIEVCKACKCRVRVNHRGEAFHLGVNKALQTIARETELIDEQLAASLGTVRRAPTWPLSQSVEVTEERL